MVKNRKLPRGWRSEERKGHGEYRTWFILKRKGLAFDAIELSGISGTLYEILTKIEAGEIKLASCKDCPPKEHKPEPERFFIVKDSEAGRHKKNSRQLWDKSKPIPKGWRLQDYAPEPKERPPANLPGPSQDFITALEPLRSRHIQAVYARLVSEGKLAEEPDEETDAHWPEAEEVIERLNRLGRSSESEALRGLLRWPKRMRQRVEKMIEEELTTTTETVAEASAAIEAPSAGGKNGTGRPTFTERKAWPWKKTEQLLDEVAKHLSRLLTKQPRTIKDWSVKYSWAGNAKRPDNRAVAVQKAEVLRTLREMKYLPQLKTP